MGRRSLASMTDITPLHDLFKGQAHICRQSGSAFAVLVLEAIGPAVGAGPPYGVYLEPWFGADLRVLFADAVALRLTGAFHYLALSGEAPRLAALYPPHAPPAPEALARALAAAAEAHPEVIRRYMASPPQTNEVNRALCLIGGFLTVARVTGLPLRCLELGASAGLIMNWDRFHYSFGGGAAWGDPAAAVRLGGAWTGPNPPLIPVTVAERRACDQAPIDVADPQAALRLRSYVWPDQTVRLERLAAAIAQKRASGGVPERADAADWAETHVYPRPGVATVVYHSSFIFYPPKSVRNRIHAAIARARAAATADAPFAWLSKEPDRQAPLVHDEVLLRLWSGGPEGAPDGGAIRRLAAVHPHGSEVTWLSD